MAARLCDDSHRLRKETDLRRSVFAGRRSLLYEPGGIPRCAARVVRCDCIRFTDLLRLLRLYRYCDRYCAVVRVSLSGEFSASVSGGVGYGILASLAHDAFTMAARLHLHICLLYTSPSPRDRQKSRM